MNFTAPPQLTAPSQIIQIMSSSVQYQSPDLLSFNTAGIAYDHKVGKEFEGATIRIRNEPRQKVKAADFENLTRTLLVPGIKEMGTEEVQSIWVGMMPADAKKYTSDAIKGTTVAPKKGASIGAGSITVLQHDTNAIRVVSLLRQAMNKYYALVNEKDGLYEAVRISQDVVFFFPSFRDDQIQAKEKRETMWSQKIKDFKAKCVQQVVSRERNTKDIERADVRLKINFTNQLQSLLATYMHDPREVHLKSMQDAVQNKDSDIGHKPLGSENLIAFVDAKDRISPAMAQAVVKEISVS